jgi:transcriptional regulator with XRE-family HTH domain
VFASYLIVTPAVVKQWENGERKPSGSSARLLQLIERKGLEIFEPIQVISQTKRAVAASELQKSTVTRKSGRPSSDVQERRR